MVTAMADDEDETSDKVPPSVDAYEGAMRAGRELIDGYAEFRAALVAARVPVLATIAFWLLIVLPDQSVESVRMMLAWPWYGAITAFLIWSVLCIYLSLNLVYSARHVLGVAAVDEQMSTTHRVLLTILFVSPAAAALIALEPINSIVSLFGADTGIQYDNIATRLVCVFFFYGWAVMPLAALVRPHPEFISIENVERLIQKEGLDDPEDVRSAAIAFIVLFVTWVSSIGFIQRSLGLFLEIPATLFVTIWATFLVFALGLLARFSEKIRFPILTAVVVWVGLLSWADLNDNHEIRHIRSNPIDQAMPPQVDEAFRGWLEARANEPDAPQPYPVFLVAAEGGGARAAYFTALVLEELRARCPRFLRHTFLMTGVSGGSLGTALVAASASNEVTGRTMPSFEAAPLPCGTERGQGASSEASRALSWDFLSISKIIWGAQCGKSARWVLLGAPALARGTCPGRACPLCPDRCFVSPA